MKIKSSLSDYISIIQKRVNSSLISEESFDDIKKITNLFPCGITSLFGFECELGNVKPDADFLFAFNTQYIGNLFFNNKNNILSKNYFDNKLWQKIQCFIDETICDNSTLYDKISIIWFEFDIKKNLAQMHAPSLFFFFNDILKKKFYNLSKEKKHNSYIETIEKSLTILKGADFFNKIKNNIEILISQMPEKSCLFQLGTMFSRPNETIRLCINKISPLKIIEYLNNFFENDIINDIRPLVSIISEFASHITIDLDVGKNISPKIGFEIYFQEKKISSKPNKIDKFLQFLINKKLCLKDKAEAIISYPEYITEVHSKTMPNNLKIASELLGQQQKYVFIKKINHFKIVYSPTTALTAKAYLAVYQTWLKQR
jgi:hypothetical protein